MNPYRESAVVIRDAVDASEWVFSDAPIVTCADFERFFRVHCQLVGLRLPTVTEHPARFVDGDASRPYGHVTIHFEERLPRGWAGTMLGIIGQRKHVGIGVSFVSPSSG